MGLYITTTQASVREQLFWAPLVRAWPWQIIVVRQLLTNPDCTEIYVKRGGRSIAYTSTGPRPSWLRALKPVEVI
jgi:hypothetical protein